jgi:hypothetical protein
MVYYLQLIRTNFNYLSNSLSQSLSCKPERWLTRSRNWPPFMEIEYSKVCSEEHYTSPHLKPVKSTRSTASQITLKILLNTILPFMSRSLNWSPSFGFLDQNVYVSSSPCYLSNQPHSPKFDYVNTWIYEAPHYAIMFIILLFICLGSKHSLRYVSLRLPQFMFSTSLDTKFHTRIKQQINIQFYTIF